MRGGEKTINQIIMNDDEIKKSGLKFSENAKEVEIYPGTKVLMWESGATDGDQTYRFLHVLFEEGEKKQHEFFIIK